MDGPFAERRVQKVVDTAVKRPIIKGIYDRFFSRTPVSFRLVMQVHKSRRGEMPSSQSAIIKLETNFTTRLSNLMSVIKQRRSPQCADCGGKGINTVGKWAPMLLPYLSFASLCVQT